MIRLIHLSSAQNNGDKFLSCGFDFFFFKKEKILLFLFGILHGTHHLPHTGKRAESERGGKKNDSGRAISV